MHLWKITLRGVRRNMTESPKPKPWFILILALETEFVFLHYFKEKLHLIFSQFQASQNLDLP